MHRLQFLVARSAWCLVLTLSLTLTARHVQAVEPGCLEKVSQCLGDALDYVSCAFINDQKECLSLNCSESDSQFVRSESCRMVQLNEAVVAVLNMTSHHCAMRLSAGCFDLAVGNRRIPDVHQVSDYLKYTCEIVRSHNVTACLTKNNGEDEPTRTKCAPSMVLKSSRVLDDVHPTGAARKKCKKKNSVPGACKKMANYTFRPIEPAKLTSALPGAASLNVSRLRVSGKERVFPKKVMAIRANRSETGLVKKRAIRKKFPKSQSVNTVHVQSLPGHRLNHPEQKRGDRVTRKPPIPRRHFLLSSSTGTVVGFRDTPTSPSVTKSNNSFFSTARRSKRKSKPVLKTTLVPHIVPADPIDLESTTKTDPYWELCQVEFFDSHVNTKDEGTSCRLSGKNLAALRVCKDGGDEMLSGMIVSGFGKHNRQSSRSSSRSGLSSPSGSHDKVKRVPRSVGSRRVTKCSSQRGLTLGMLKKGKGFFKCSKLCNPSLDKRPGAKKFRSFGSSPQHPHKLFRKKEKSLRTKIQHRVILDQALRRKAPLHKKCASGKTKRVISSVNRKPCTKHRSKEINAKKLESSVKLSQTQPSKTMKKVLHERKRSSSPTFPKRKATFQAIPFSYSNISASNHVQHFKFSQSVLQSGVWQKITQSSRISPYQGLHHSLSCSAFHPYQKPSSDPRGVNPNAAPRSGVKNNPADEQMRHAPLMVTYSPRSAIHKVKKDSKSLSSSAATLARQSKDEISYLKERRDCKMKQYSGSNFERVSKNGAKAKLRSLSCSPKRSKKSESKRACCTSYHNDLHDGKYRRSRSGMGSVTKRGPERSPVHCTKSPLSRTSSGVQCRTRASSGVQCRTRVSSGVQCPRRASSGVQGHKRASSGVQCRTQASSGAQGHSRVSSGVQCHTRANSGVQCHTRANSGVKCHTRASSGVQCHTRANSGVQCHHSQNKTKLKRSISSKSYVSRRSTSPPSLGGKKLISKINKNAAKHQTSNSPPKQHSKPTLKQHSKPTLLDATQVKARLFPNKSINQLKAGDRMKSSHCEFKLNSPFQTETRSRNRSHSNKCSFSECSYTGSETVRGSPCNKSMVSVKSRFKKYASKSVTPFPIFSITSHTSGSTLKMNSSSERFCNVSRVNKRLKENDVKGAWSELGGHPGRKKTKEVTTGATNRFGGREKTSNRSGQQGPAKVELLSASSAVLSANASYPKAALVTTKGLYKRTYFFDEGMEEEPVVATSEHSSYQWVMQFLSKSFSSSQQNQGDLVRSCSHCNKEMSVGDTKMYRILRDGASELIGELSSQSFEKDRCALSGELSSPSVENDKCSLSGELSSPSVENDRCALSGELSSPFVESDRCELKEDPESFRDDVSSGSSTVSSGTLRNLSLHCTAESDGVFTDQSSSDHVAVPKLSSTSETWCSFHSDSNIF